jgi:hypothetical protein
MALAKVAQIGASQAELAPLSSLATGIPLSIPQPEMRYYPYRRQVKLTSRKVTGVGGPYIVWHWGFLKAEWRHALREVLTGVSTEIYIESLMNDESDDDDGTDAWGQFSTIAIWPDGDEDKDAGRRLGFDIEFEIIEQLTPLE